MLKEVLQFEWRYQTRQASFALAAVFFLGFGFFLTSTGFGPDALPLAAPHLVMLSAGFVSLFSVFAVAIFSAHAVLRDTEHKMEEIVFGTPVGRFPYLFGRFAGALAAGLCAVSCALPGMALATRMPWQDPARVGGLDALAYLWALVVMLLPNLLFVSALLFVVAVLTRSTVASTVGAVFVYILYFVGAAFTESPLMAQSRPGAGGGLLPSLLDPLGLTAFFEDTRYWTIAEKGSRLLPLAGTFLLNRLLWLAAAAALLGLAFRVFRFRLLRRSGKAPEQATAAAPSVLRAYAPVEPRPRAGAAWLSQCAIELKALFQGWPVALLLLAWAALAGSEAYSALFDAEYGSASYPATSLLLGALTQPVSLIGTVLLVYFSAEVFWRERRYGFFPIVDATPLPGALMIAAKWVALSALALLVVGTAVLVGLGFQLAHGYRPLEPGLYAAFVYFAGVPLVVFAGAALLLQALSPGRYVGLLLVLAFGLATHRAQALGLEHPLWRFAAAPGVRFSDLNGFAHDAGLFHALALYWAAGALACLGLAARLWRSLGAGLRERSRTLLAAPWPRLATAATAAALVGSALLVHRGVSASGGTTSTREQLGWKADYERRYRARADEPQPRVTAVEVEADLFPEEERFELRGRYGLRNETGRGLARVLVQVPRGLEVAALEVPGARAEHDARFAMHTFELPAPLAPGATTELRFVLRHARRGYGRDVRDDLVVENGSLLWSFRAFPSLGYHRSYEINDPAERRRQGLPGPSLGKEGEEDQAFGGGRIAFSAVVSTSADQVAVAPGHLERRWEENGRRSFHYRAEAPIVNLFAIASARYAVAQAREGGVEIEVYHHPAHAVNVGRMLGAARDSLRLFQERFGPYPHRELRVVEVPSYWPMGGFAMPGLVLFVENRGFLTDTRDPRRPDLVTRRIAHEVAHQWWGHLVSAPPGPGASLVTETLAKDAELLVLEHTHGPEHVRRQLEVEMDNYLGGRARSGEPEATLLHVDDQSFVYYAKGSLALHALRQEAGSAAVDRALLAFRQEYGRPEARPSALALREHLRRELPPAHHARLEEWLGAIVLYELKLERAEARRLADGRYEVHLRVEAKKALADPRGREQPAELLEAVPIAVFDAEEKPLHLQAHPLRSGANAVALTVAARPAFAVVDPDLTRIDRNRADNSKEISAP